MHSERLQKREQNKNRFIISAPLQTSAVHKTLSLILLDSKEQAATCSLSSKTFYTLSPAVWGQSGRISGISATLTHVASIYLHLELSVTHLYFDKSLNQMHPLKRQNQKKKYRKHFKGEVHFVFLKDQAGQGIKVPLKKTCVRRKS